MAVSAGGADATKSSCCYEQENVIEMMESNAENPDSACAFHAHHQGKTDEETGLQGLKYKPLCSCEDQQQYCGCRVQIEKEPTDGAPAGAAKTGANVLFESWGKWKCYALSILVVGICLWMILFFSLFFGL